MGTSAYFDFTADSWTEAQTADYRLYELHSQVASQIAVFNEENQLQLLLEWDTTQPHSNVQQLLNARYRERTLLVTHEQMLLVPDTLHTDTPLHLYRQFLSPGTDATIYAYGLKQLPITFIYTLRNEDSEGSPVALDNYVPAAAVWIESLSLMAAHYPAFLGVQLHHGEAEFVFFRNGNLQFYNRFPKADADEFTYFLLNVLKTLEIDPHTVNVVVSGEIRTGDENHDRLTKYCRNTRFVPLNGLWQPDAGNDNRHRVFNLLASALCAL